MRSLLFASTVAAAAVAAAPPRYVMFFDQYHTSPLPSKDTTAGITHVMIAFANSSIFTTDPPTEYKPFMELPAVRALFDNGTKICLSSGGWGDTVGFGIGLTDDASRKLYAKNVAYTLDKHGFDCFDVDLEFPGGNGADYKQVPNSAKVSQIQTFPLLLKEIKAAIGSKELSIDVPGKQVDMIAYTNETVPVISDAVDFVNVMTYDLMNRRDNVTDHHASVSGSLNTVLTYLNNGMSASKMVLGFAFYAKWFTTADGVTCTGPVGCKTALLENPDGSDPGLSGALTFEAKYVSPTPTNLTASTDNSCGVGTFFKCTDSSPCCSTYGFCGSTPAHCGTGCQGAYGTCNTTVDVNSLYHKALANGVYDQERGGQWYWDASAHLFFTWNTPEIMTRKINDIVIKYKLGGIMAWSLVEDSFDWSHIGALRTGFKAVQAASGGCRHG